MFDYDIIYNIISLGFIKKLRIAMRSDGLEVKGVDGVNLRSYRKTQVTLRIKNHSKQISVNVVDIPDLEVILGMLWFQLYKPSRDWKLYVEM